MNELSPEHESQLALLVRRHVSDEHFRPSPIGLVGFDTAIESIRRLQYDMYENGLERVGLEAAVELATISLARLLRQKLCTTTVFGQERLAINLLTARGRGPLMLYDVMALAEHITYYEALEDLYVGLLIDPRFDWRPGVYPRVQQTRWTRCYWGVEIPGPIAAMWQRLIEMCITQTGTQRALVRHLGLSAPELVVRGRWSELEDLLHSARW